ncbi:CU044_2847 family protein [Verrucosispora sp. WMMA2044]|uniref:CU044_2847 family protein n=1 Tax=Verrucosispora sp. WMMA2044 TaxID=3016419 RepID=UPI00248D16B6|nr:CU044_2847 family protein [Verrucosispora sp. WMMA2044]WBB48431.1 CU044_2847 family protein [Verrucosispora sp. WMMA2044]
MNEETGSAGVSSVVPLHIDGHLIYLAGAVLDAQQGSDEVEVASRPLDLDEALSALAAFAVKVGDRLKQADVSRLAIEFSCEFAVESGKLVAVLGKASTKSGVKVGLEWDRTRHEQPC